MILKKRTERIVSDLAVLIQYLQENHQDQDAELLGEAMERVEDVGLELDRLRLHLQGKEAA